MSFLERLQLASEEGWAGILYVALTLFSSLVLLYLILSNLKRKKSLLNKKEQEHLDLSLKLLKEQTNAPSKSIIGPLGTEALCKGSDEVRTYAIIPFSSCLTSTFLEKMSAYCKAMSQEKGNFTELSLIQEEGKGLVVQNIDTEKWISLHQYLMDRKMSPFEKETLLLQVALAIGSLHMVEAIDDQKIYHGYIRPQAVLLSLDDNECIQRVCIKDHGLLWALDRNIWLEAIEKVNPKKGLAYFDSKLSYAAPELLDGSEDLSPAVDFYSFGLLAKELLQEDESNEETMPKRWRGFVKKCLSRDAKERPSDFLELDDLLNDPEINAHFEEVEKKQAEMGHEHVTPLKNARELFMQLRDKQAQPSVEAEDPRVDKGFSLLKNRQWLKAISHFQELEKESPSSRVLLGLAIGLHQKGERDQAEKVYMDLKKQDPSLVSEFHSFLARGV